MLGSTLSAGNTPIADMPTSGSAGYEGVLALGGAPGAVTPQSIFADPQTLGVLSMTANFGSQTVTGRADDFRASNGDAVDGALAITGGTISGRGFNADINGTLVRGGTATSYAGDVAGNFFGAGADALAGTVVVVGQPAGGAPGIVYGAVVAD